MPSTAPDSRRSRTGLRLRIGEIGWQVGSRPLGRRELPGTENVPVTDEAAQAEIYGELVRRAACDPAITLRPLLRPRRRARPRPLPGGAPARGRHRASPSYDAVASRDRRDGRALHRHAGHVAARDDGRRRGRQLRRPRAELLEADRVGLRRHRRRGGDVTARASYRLPASAKRHAAALRALQSDAVAGRAGAGTVRAHWTPRVVFPSRRLGRGRYVYARRARRDDEPGPQCVFVSAPFVVR